MTRQANLEAVYMLRPLPDHGTLRLSARSDDVVLGRLPFALTTCPKLYVQQRRFCSINQWNAIAKVHARPRDL